MKNVLKNGLAFLSNPQGDILSAGFIIMFLSLVSGIFGLVRNRLLTSFFTEDLIGVYFASFVIPDNIFQILVVSAVGAAFIPVFAKYQQKGHQWEFANALLHLSLILILIIIILVSIFLVPLSSILVPGIQKEDPGHIALFVNLTRIILAAQVFFVFSYLFTGVLQSYQRFLIPASAAIFYNIGIIAGTVFLAPQLGMYGVAIGIIAGAFLHLLIQLPFVLSLGFRPTITATFFHPGVFEIVKLMAPRTLSIAVERVKITVDTILASLISLGSIGFLNFALQVAVFPITLFASAIAQAALPFLAKAVANGNMEEFKKQTVMSLTHIAFFLAPASVLLIVLHTPIVRVIFGGRYFSWEATFLTSWTLVFLAIGLFAQGAGIVLARAFYALFDTKTPLTMTLISMSASIVLSLVMILSFKLPVWSLGLATTAGSFINASLLFLFLDKRVGGFPHLALSRSLLKILFISLVFAAFAYGLFKILEDYFDTNYGLPLLLFTALVAGVSGLFYFFLSYIFNLEEYKAIFQFFKKATRLRQKFFPVTPLVDEPKQII